MSEDSAIEKARTMTRLVHHFWLIAAKEALQGDMGKLRRKVAMAEGRTHDDVIADMEAALSSPDSKAMTK